MAQPKHHSAEAAIAEAVDACAERAFAFLDALVREPSVPGAEQGAEDILAAELDRVGMAVERVPFPAGIERDPDLELSDGVWALLASRLREWFNASADRGRALGAVGGVSMIGLGVALAVTGRPE